MRQLFKVIDRWRQVENKKLRKIRFDNFACEKSSGDATSGAGYGRTVMGEVQDFRTVQPCAVWAAGEQQVIELITGDIEDSPVLMARPTVSDVDVAAWIKGKTSQFAELLARHGAIVFRGFGPVGVADFQRFATACAGGPPKAYVERSTTRTQVAPGIYTSTEYQPHREIALHNENAFQRDWPTRIMLFAQSPSKEGGETILADNLRVTNSLPRHIVAEFAERQVLYVRNYGRGYDLSWQDAFQTNDPVEAQSYCTAAEIEWEWRTKDCLRTRQRRPALVEHPLLGQQLWFNQAHLFHLSNLDPEVQSALLASLGRENLPRNAYFGDGGEIPLSYLDAIRASYRTASALLRWEEGDMLVVDNIRAAHGRAPYQGPRTVLFALGRHGTQLDVTP